MVLLHNNAITSLPLPLPLSLSLSLPLPLPLPLPLLLPLWLGFSVRFFLLFLLSQTGR